MTTLCPNCEWLAIEQTETRSASMRAAILECDQGHRFQLRFLTPVAVSYSALTRENGTIGSDPETRQTSRDLTHQLDVTERGRSS